jgi:hypothetical protein
VPRARRPEVLKAHNDRAAALDARLARLQGKLSRD